MGRSSGRLKGFGEFVVVILFILAGTTRHEITLAALKELVVAVGPAADS